MESVEENSNMRVSRLRPPSQIQSPGKGLSEISESQSNVRSKLPSMLPPPSSLPSKHKLQQYSEPDPKRKTLVERAGEINGKSSATAASSSRPAIKGNSLVGVFKSMGRNQSSTSSKHSRTASVSSRNTSNGSHGSFASSVGVYNRPQTSYSNRPGAFGQSTMTRTASNLPKSRPGTSMEHNLEGDDISGDRRKGTSPIISIPFCDASLQGQPGIKSKKIRGPMTNPPLRTSESMPKSRDFSISTAMTRLKLDGDMEPCGSKERQANSTKKAAVTVLQSHKLSLSLRDQRANSGENALVLYQDSGDSLVAPKTPSQIPVLFKMEALKDTPATPCKPSKQSPQKTPFLTKDSNVPGFIAWDVDGRLDVIESMYSKFEETIKSTTLDRTGLEEAITAYKARIFDLESQKAQLDSSRQALQHDLEIMRQKADMLQQRLATATANLDDKMRDHHAEIDELKRGTRDEVDKLRRDNLEEIDKLLRLHREDMRKFERQAATELEDKIKELERRHEAKLDDERDRRAREVQDLESKITSESLNGGLELKKKEQELQNLRGEIEDVKSDLDREQTLKANAQNEILQMKELLKKAGTESSSTIQSLESTVASLRARIHFLESGSKAQSDSFAEMESRLQDAVRSAEVSKQKLVKEETLRRILFNQVQELKGNIRVMCRVRPIFNANENGSAKISFPDVEKESKELAIQGKEEKSSLGTVTRKNHSFTFDRVFGPESQNQEVFEEISQLVQSALDGYNVCIFCYGQTGSGKTHTMSSEDGMIPRATHQIYETATSLKEKGWEYTMEGSFVEVYNEEIHDLLNSSSDKKKHDIRHDDSKKQTIVTGLKTVALDSPNTVETMLKLAANNRSVAATKSNERSSRSHSVFILKLVGRNTMTGETSEGTLNLVDLAGSERLKQSGAEGDRMKETQNINKSLSCLGDVIGALGQGKEGAHIPYRNSKLTYLLQYSLGGNSKTLMFVMASPLEAHLSETLTSLKFATKVHNTHIGTAKKSTKSS